MNPQITQKSLATSDNATIEFFEYTTPSSTQNPGLIILHGGLSSSFSHSELALALCSTLPVYLPNRRGRGASSDPSEDLSIQTEINDLKSLLLTTKAKYVLGVSSGAIISLYGALEFCASSGNDGLVEKIVIFEPPIIVSDYARFEQMKQRFEREIEEDKIAEAFITALRITKMVGRFFNLTPRRLLTPLVRFGLWMERKKSTTGREGIDREYPVGKLIPTLRFDLCLVKELQGNIAKLGKLDEMKIDILLLSGSKSPDYLKNNVEELKKLLPKAKHAILDGLDHLGLGNKNVGGKPEQVAIEVRKFLV